MQHKRKELASQREKIILFLRNINLKHSIMNSLLNIVQSQHLPSGSLPDELEIMQLATTISTSIDSAGRSRDTPRRANKILQSDQDLDFDGDPLDSDYCTEIMRGS